MELKGQLSRIQQLEQSISRLTSVLTDEDKLFSDKTIEKWLTDNNVTVRKNVVTGNATSNYEHGLNRLVTRIWFDCEAVYKGVSKVKIQDGLDLIAYKNRFNPWLDSIPVWDGKNYFQILCLALRSPTGHEGLWEWLVGLVGMQMLREVLEADNSVWRPQMLLLVGGQGRGKDWLINGLGVGCTMQCIWEGLLTEKRDELRRAKRCVVASISEDPTAYGKAIEGVKRFLTLTSVRTRGMFERFDDEDNALLCSFAGSTNEMSPLRDATGNRRFCVIDCDRKVFVPSFNFLQLLAQVKAFMEQWLQTPTRDYPWLRYDYAENEERNKRFLTAPDIWSDQLEMGYHDAVDKTVSGIRDSIEDVDARRYYTQGRNLFFGLQRLGYYYNGITFQPKEQHEEGNLQRANNGGRIDRT